MKLQHNIDLFPYLSMRLHTKAEYFFEAKTKEDLFQAIQTTHASGMPLTILGGGSNLVFHSSIIQGLVMKNSYADIRVVSENDDTIDIEVGSGTNMGVLVQYISERGYSGLEYHKGLPGTVGGAVYMNSKWTRPLTYVGDCVTSALLSDASGKEKQVTKEYFSFAYDYSKLQDTHEYVISVTFRLNKSTSDVVTQHAKEAQTYRSKTQPAGRPTCGCFFRNLPTKSAGYLIDMAGMKGQSVGSFAVSDIHANFIVNTGGDARPEDLKQLILQIKEKVLEKFGIQLEEEVQVL
jgi:UDP-N-acetylmuramate dehydrogenase